MTSHRRRKLILAYIYCCIGLLPEFVLNIVIPIDTCEVAFRKPGTESVLSCLRLRAVHQPRTNKKIYLELRKKLLKLNCYSVVRSYPAISNEWLPWGSQGSINVYHLILSSRVLRIGSA